MTIRKALVTIRKEGGFGKPQGLLLAVVQKVAKSLLASFTKSRIDVLRSRACQRVALVDHIVLWHESDTPPPRT